MQAQVHFYLPLTDEEFSDLPAGINAYWTWQTSASGLSPYWGRYHWTLQTYLFLKEAGFPVSLTNRLPDEGILITHIDCLDYTYCPPKDLFFVALLVDRETPHPYAHLHVTHNPTQKLPLGLRYRYMTPWPQVGLKPRNPAFGNRFERIAFFGYPVNLHPDLKDEKFQERLSELELRITMPAPRDWHDFSDVDAVLAIRNFGSTNQHLNKSSLKLYNAWLAGVPAVLGHEDAFRTEGKPGVDYLEATNLDEVLSSLKRLRNDPGFRHSLVSAGSGAVTDFLPEKTVGRWISLFEKDILPQYQQWQKRPWRYWTNRIAGRFREGILWRRPGWFS